jgi:hypothetical protein
MSFDGVKSRHHLVSLLRDLVPRRLRDGRRLSLDRHLAVSLSNTARTMALNGIPDAMLNAYTLVQGRASPISKAEMNRIN